MTMGLWGWAVEKGDSPPPRDTRPWCPMPEEQGGGGVHHLGVVASI